MAAGQQGSEKYKHRFDADPDLAWKALLRHYRLTKPLIAAVEGYAVAGGTEILQATDIRVAAETAIFGVTEVTRGLFPLGGSTVRLRRQIPYTLAADILLTGRHVKAPEAKEIGLISHVVPHGQALAKAREIADTICANGPLAVQAVLRSLRETEGMSEVDGLEARARRSASRSSAPRTRARGRRRSRRSASRSSRGASRAHCTGSTATTTLASVTWMAARTLFLFPE